MNRIIFSALLLSGVAVNAQQQQVGINTAEPKATLHVEAGASENKGVIIPRITAAEMKTMTAGLGADHHAIITYLKDQLPAADQTGKLAEVSEAGYYFYNHTIAKWQKFGGAEQDFKAIPTSMPGFYNYLSKGSGIGGASLGTGMANIGIGGPSTFNFTNSTKMTGDNNIGLGAGIFQFLNGATMSSYANIGIGGIVYSLLNGGSMTGSGQNIGLGNGIYRFQKTNAQFSGGNNISIGQNIFQLTNGNLTGGGNIGMGNGLYTLVSGDMAGGANIGIGENSYYVRNGNITSTANSNIALGSNIYRLTNASTFTFSGQSNIGIGRSLYNLSSGNLTGQGNIGMGSDVFRLTSGNFSGNDNIGIGTNAMLVSGNISGTDNIGIGTNAMNASGGIAGNYNIALGYQSMYSSGKVAGTDNIAIGYQAIQPSSSSDIGSYNIGIGNWALYGSMGNGNANIQLGNWYVGTPVAGQLNNVVAIGNEMTGLGITNTDSNTILLGKRGSDGPKVGIGTYKPGAKLEINNGTTAGAVKIVDGTQGAGKVLTSDANGLATWKRQALTLVEGVKGSGINIPPSTGGYIYTGSYITLPPGKYMVSVQNLMSVGFTTYSDGHFWLRTTFSDSSTTFTRTADIDSTKGYLISGLLPQGARFNMLNGSLIIENTTSSPKTYYYWAGQVDVTSGTTKPLQNFGGWAEWSMTATPIQ